MMVDVDRRGAQADGSASKTTVALGAVGVAMASLTINLAAVCDPRPGFGDSTCYHLALVGSFLAGVAQVGAAVWVADDPRGRHAVGKKIVYASIAPLAIAVGLTGAAALLW